MAPLARLTALIVVGCHAPVVPLDPGLAAARFAELSEPEESVSEPGVLSLSQAIDRALQHHLALKQAQAEVEMAEAGVLVARSARNPELRLRGRDQPGALTPPEYTTQLRISTEYPGVRAARVAGARAWEAAEQSALEDTERQIRGEVAVAFHQVVALREEVGVAERQVGAAQRLRDQARDGLEAGLISAGDLLDAEADFAEATEDLAGVQRNLRGWQRDLRKWLAWPDGVELALAEEQSAVRLDDDLPALPSLLERALGTRSDLQASQAQLRVSEYSLRAQRRQAIPWLSFVQGSLDLGPAQPVGYGATVGVELPLWNWNVGGVRQARAALARQSSLFDGAVLEVAQDVRERWEEAQEARTTWSALHDTLEQAQALWKLTEQDPDPVRRSQLRYRVEEIRLKEHRARRQYMAAMDRLHHSVGDVP